MMTDERLAELHAFIAQARGASVQVWRYSASLSELTVRITFRGSADNVHLVCNNCSRMEMASSWQDAEFSLSSRDEQYVLRDEKAGFAVCCGMIRVLRNQEPFFLP